MTIKGHCGLFVVSGTLIAIIAVIVLGAGSLFREKALFETFFEESLQCLEIGSPLKCRGLRIGKVEDISLVSKAYLTERRYALVRANLSDDAFQKRMGKMVVSDLKSDVEKGLRARLGFQGLTGTVHHETDHFVPKKHPSLLLSGNPPKETE